LIGNTFIDLGSKLIVRQACSNAAMQQCIWRKLYGKLAWCTADGQHDGIITRQSVSLQSSAIIQAGLFCQVEA